MQRLTILLLASLFTACTDDATPPEGDAPTEAPTEAPPTPPETDTAVQIGTRAPAKLDIPLTSDAYAAVQIEGENMQANVASGVYPSSLAKFGNGTVRVVFANGDIGQWFYLNEAGWRAVSVAAQGSYCSRGWPTMQTFVFNQPRNTWTWWSSAYSITSQISTDYNRYFPYWMGTTFFNAGWNYLLVRMGNDSATSTCDANLVVDYAYIQ